MAFPQTPLPIVIEIFTTTWVDITSYVLVRDGIEITRGFQDEQSSPEPSKCTLTLNNRDGRFSPRNPTGPYYGLIGRNTPLRVSVTGYGVRFIGEVSEWPSRWDVAGVDVWVPVVAQGILRRLGQGGFRPKSALYSTLWGGSNVTVLPVAYWPLEGEGKLASFLASAISPAMNGTYGSSVRLGTGEAPPGSTGSVAVRSDLNTQSKDLSLPVAAYTATTHIVTVHVMCPLDEAPVNTAHILGAIGWSVTGTLDVSSGSVDMSFGWNLTGQQNKVELAGNTGGFQLLADAELDDGNWHELQARLTQNGANVDIELWVDGVLGDSDTVVGTLGQISRFWGVGGIALDSGENLVDGHVRIHYCHLSLHTDASVDQFYNAMTGLPGETAGRRIERLCESADIPFGSLGDLDAAVAMGPQSADTLKNQLDECWIADMGYLYETRDELGLTYRTRSSLYNQAPTLALTYTGTGEVAPPLEPVEDDQHVRNDITVKRKDGAQFTAVDETSRMSVQPPPDGVGRYEVEVEVNVESDDQLPDQAYWRLGVGTFDGVRYPSARVDLAALAAAGKATLQTAAAELDVGDRVTITDLPAWQPPEDADLLALGFTETLLPFGWDITYNCVPYGPWQVGVLAEDEMTMLVAKSTTNTSFRIASDPAFTTDAADFPVALLCDGEEVSATSAVNVAIALNNGTPVHGDNASLQPVPPGHAEGDLLILAAAIRNSGTGTVDAIGGWTSFATAGNFRLFNKYATSDAEPTPTVTFTGGAAGDTTSAVIIRARGLQLANPAVNVKTQLNGSAQDIAYPYYVQEGDTQIFQFCWKQDDFTSVAPGSPLNEVLEASTTTGNDQSIYIARGPVSGDSFSIPASSHTVTGGAAAISRVIFVTFLRGVVDLTVTRSVNGVVTTHAQLADIQVAEPMNLAL